MADQRETDPMTNGANKMGDAVLIRATIEKALKTKTDEDVGAMIQAGRKNPPLNAQILRSLSRGDQNMIGVLMNAYWDRGIGLGPR
jgi:hypothetical protein